jgi:Arc/MetJ-type ribon-helix-helix transcriptional regulator
VVSIMMKEINISLDESDLEKLMEWFHSSSEDEAVRSAISHLLNKKVYSDLLEFEGKIQWEGNLEEMREERLYPS